eukprot:6209396-Pleurochrysis_carterae.AAC.2
MRRLRLCTPTPTPPARHCSEDMHNPRFLGQSKESTSTKSIRSSELGGLGLVLASTCQRDCETGRGQRSPCPAMCRVHPVKIKALAKQAPDS